MAPPPKGVVFGPVSDWGKGSCKLLLEHDGEGVPEFGEKGMEALSQAVLNTENGKKGWKGEGDWFRHISQLERDHKDEEETLRVTDETSAGRAIEILNSVANGDLDGVDAIYETTEKDGDMLESITLRSVKTTDDAGLDKSHYWSLTNPKWARRAEVKGIAKEQPKQVEELAMEGVEEYVEDSDNETIRAISMRRGKKARIETSLSELEKKLGPGPVEPATPRILEEIRDNLFQATQRTMDWAEDEIPDLDMDLDRSQVKGLTDSLHTVRSLSEEELNEMTEKIVEGQGKRAEKEDDEMRGEEEEEA
ncbi:hypothetical protein EV426DRAFT_705075 [Tirmania nivea]|nr:hypothetical protein EV426DRAFT_705075 [Tirmania nivea]